MILMERIFRCVPFFIKKCLTIIARAVIIIT
nr:MAG TPA: serine/threonine-protein kinase [Bacteriophage sp.]